MLSKKDNQFFVNYVNKVLSCETLHEMSQYVQHGRVSCLDHCLSVSYYSYWLCLKLRIKVDIHSIIRGALLHDFFLYDWHNRSEGHKLHGFRHPRTALHNAEKYFNLNDIEKDIIIKHMWPLTIQLPKTKESFIVSLIDKCCSLSETFHLKYFKLPSTIRYEKESLICC